MSSHPPDFRRVPLNAKTVNGIPSFHLVVRPSPSHLESNDSSVTVAVNRTTLAVRPRADFTLCPPPSLDSKFVAQNVDNWPQHREAFFAHGTVLEIGCTSFSPVEKNAFWKCRRGKWQVKGATPNCPARKLPHFEALENPFLSVDNLCTYKVDRSARVQVFHVQTRQFVVFNQQFGIGAKLLFTCADHFMDQLRGSMLMECTGKNEWSYPAPPHCVPLDPDHKRGKTDIIQ